MNNNNKNNNKALKQPIIKSKLPSNKQTGCKQLVQLKNSNLLQEKYEPKRLQKQTVTQKKNLTFTITNVEEFRTQSKKIEDLKGNTLTEYNITLTSLFENDKQVQTLCFSLRKIGSLIRNLVWNIEGNYTDDGHADEIGRAISRMSNAYSIVLNIGDSNFGDKGATSLGTGLSYLKDLKVLKLNIQIYIIFKKNFLTQEGINKIIQGIKTLSQLQVLETNVFPIDYTKNEWKKLNNCVIELQNIYDEEYNLSLPLTLEQFPNLIKQIQSNVITELLIRRKYRNIFFFYSKEQISFETAQALLLNAVRYSIESFPNLTVFTNQILNSDQMQDVEEDNNSLFQYVKTFEELVATKLAMVVQIQAFNLFLKKEQMVNPSMILVDLFID